MRPTVPILSLAISLLSVSMCADLTATSRLTESRSTDTVCNSCSAARVARECSSVACSNCFCKDSTLHVSVAAWDSALAFCNCRPRMDSSRARPRRSSSSTRLFSRDTSWTISWARRSCWSRSLARPRFASRSRVVSICSSISCSSKVLALPLRKMSESCKSTKLLTSSSGWGRAESLGAHRPSPSSHRRASEGPKFPPVVRRRRPPPLLPRPSTASSGHGCQRSGGSRCTSSADPPSREGTAEAVEADREPPSHGSCRHRRAQHRSHQLPFSRQLPSSKSTT
mmetsp:Transcript_82468/g.267138  ORF Transcript_82468/g.267138 Transcript_82468/m.267138 type:complete len:283 (+) Transcript_82468:69-917(+)